MLKSVEDIASKSKAFSLFHAKCVTEGILFLKNLAPTTYHQYMTNGAFDFGNQPPAGIHTMEVQVRPPAV